MTPFTFASLNQTLPCWALNLVGTESQLLDEIGVTDFDVLSDDTQLKFTGTLAWLEEIEFKIPALDSVSVAFLSTGGFTQIPFELQIGPKFELRLTQLHASLRLSSAFLKPVKLDKGKWVALVDPQGKALPAEITLGGVDAVVDADGDIALVGLPSLSLTPVDIGGTGIVLEMREILLYLSGKDPPPTGEQPGFKGIAIGHAELHLSGGIDGFGPPTEVTFDRLRIGNSGFSGTIGAKWTGTAGQGQLFGMPFTLEVLSLTFKQNVPTGSSLTGKVQLPFFDHPVKVEIGFAAGGHLTVGIDDPTGLAKLTIPDVLELELDSLKFDVDDGVLTATLSGKLTPKVPGLRWPTIDLKDLKIDSKGNVKLPGGWLDLPKQYGFDFHGFKVDITKFGMGRNEDGTKWIGFSGGVKLVDGLPAGASVEGLRITAPDDWSKTKISFNGVGVEFDVPDVLYFKGDIAYRETTDATGAEVHRFDGDIKLKLHALKLEIDGALVVGSVAKTTSTPAYHFFAIYVDVEMLNGIPFGTTGVAFYGFAGLLALDMEPDKHADEPWYGVGAGEGWYKRGTEGVTDLKNKWRNQLGSKAFGAGITLGTYADNGFTFNGKVLVAIVFPGPIVLFQGMANLLKDRTKLSEEPRFRALAVLDNRAKSFLIGLDTKYKFRSGGELITISGGAEVFYKFDDPTAWHLYLGKLPRPERIQARLFKILDANAYFMLDAHQLAMGAWVGFDKSWDFDPLSITLQAWAEGNVIVSFKPGHFSGDLRLHGAVRLEVFRFGIGITLDASLAAEVFDPFHIRGDFSVSIDLPWPFPDFSAHAEIEWGPRPDPPDIPIALKDVAIEHFKISAKWPLPTSTSPPLLIPNYGDSEGYLTPPAAVDDKAPPPPNAPVVPPDCRPSLAFGRNVHDDAKICLLVQAPDPASEWIGDPHSNKGPVNVRYGLEKVQLDRWDVGTPPSSWKPVAGKGTGIANLPELFGTWGPVPGAKGVAQNKLLLWSKTAFDHTRHTGSEWGDWFAAAHPDYPCFPVPPPSRRCLDFEGFDSSKPMCAPLTHPDYPGVSFDTGPGATPFVFRVADVAIAGKHHKALCRTTPGTAEQLAIDFSEPVNNVRITAVNILLDGWNGGGYGSADAYVYAKSGIRSGPFRLVDNVVDIAVDDVTKVTLVAPDIKSSPGFIYLLEVCADFREVEGALLQSIHDHNETATAAAWKSVGDVLAPYTNYRLAVTTSIQVRGSPFNRDYTPTQFAFFQTGGPPGLAASISPPDPANPRESSSGLTIPAGAANPQEFNSGLGDLTHYVGETIPPTVAATGEKPLLPRPVYRAYDVGVLFNEDYVDLMYRLAGRDLSLVLYDRNNLPLRDRSGRLVVRENPWGVTENLSLSEKEDLWLALLAGSGCVAALQHTSIPRDRTLTAAGAAQLLAPDMLYEARLVPLLLHEDFGEPYASPSGPGRRLGRWRIEDPGTVGGPSHWAIEEFGVPPAHRVIQTSAVHGPSAAGDVAPLGTMLVLEDYPPGLPANDPGLTSNWSDCRISVDLRSSTSTGSIGLAFRYHDAGTFYLLVLDLQNSRRRLVAMSGGTTRILAEDAFIAGVDRDYHLVIEAIGPSLRAYLDDVRIFDVNDPTIASGERAAIANGGIALHCNDNTGAAFSDIQVHDFSDAARSVYRFGFTTSEFVNFFHHIHSFDDHCWVAECALDDTVLGGIVQYATADGAPPIPDDEVVHRAAPISDDETRAFERLADDVLGPSARQQAQRTEVTRIERQGVTLAFLVRSSEPVDWHRSSLSLSQTRRAVPPPLIPGAAKLVTATLGAQQARDESVSLLVRQSLDLSGYRIEKRDLSAVRSTDPLPPALDDAASTWVPVYQFGAEIAASDGTCVMIYSGSPDDAPPALDSVWQRFSASTGEVGELKLAEDAVDLRLVAPDGTVAHARRFLKDELYNPLQVRLLRKADGTAFFIFPVGPLGSGFAQGSCRMATDFRRENVAVDPGSIVLSEAGQTSPESASLDVPWPPI